MKKQNRQIVKHLVSPMLAFLLIFSFAVIGGLTGAQTSLTAQAYYGEDEQYEGVYTYIVQEDSAIIVDGSEAQGNLVIPDTLGGYPVTEIYSDAFSNNSDLTAAVIPDSVTKIGSCAFEYCDNLTAVTFGSNLAEIGDFAFSDCESLKDVYYKGSQTQWDAIVINYGNDALTEAKIHYNYDPDHVHSYTSAVTTQPTCVKTGIMTYTCPCGESYTETIPATGKHTNVTTVTKATTVNDGKIDVACSVCKTVAKSAVIPKVSSIALSAKYYTYDGKAKTPTVTVKDSKGKVLKLNTDYTVKYASGRKNVGPYAVLVTLQGKYYSGTKTLAFKILPLGTTFETLTATSGGFTAKWKKQAAQTTGYQLQYSTSSSFGSYKTITIWKNSVTSQAVTKLNGNAKYYVRIRTFTSVGDTYYFSTWSSAKAVTTKPVIGIKITSSVALYVGGSKTLAVSTYPTKVTIKWKSSDTSVATVSSAGKVTAVKKGTATICGYFTYGGKNYKAYCSVTVKNPGVVLSKSSIKLAEKASYVLKATTAPSNATVKWKSSNTAVATVNSAGKVVGVKKGTATIGAYISYAGKTYKAYCTVTVTATPSTVTSFNKLKNYIITYGGTNSDGNKFIKQGYYNDDYIMYAAAIYNAKTNKITFLYTQERRYSTGFDATFKFEMGPNQTSTQVETIQIYYQYNEAVVGGGAYANLNIRSFTKNTDVNFRFDSSSSASMRDPEFSDLIDEEFQYVFELWDTYIRETVGVSMRDLGFTSYK